MSQSLMGLKTKAEIRKALGVPSRSRVEIRKQLLRVSDMVIFKRIAVITLPNGEIFTPWEPLEMRLTIVEGG